MRLRDMGERVTLEQAVPDFYEEWGTLAERAGEAAEALRAPALACGASARAAYSTVDGHDRRELREALWERKSRTVAGPN